MTLLTRAARAALHLFILAASGAVLASLAAPLHPALDSIAHFRLHLAAALAVASLVALAWGPRALALCSLAIVGFAAVWTAPYLPGLATRGQAAAPHSLRVLQFNMRFDNHETRRAAAYIRSQDPDVVLLQEATGGIHSLKSLLAEDYPVRAVCPARGWKGGSVILSRLPFARADAVRCSRDSSLVATQLLLDGKAVSFASIHLQWPWPMKQEAHLDSLAPMLSALPHPLVITGDFNATPWSRTLTRTAGLTGTTVAPGYRPSWLTFRAPDWMRPLAGLPIDQILTSADFRVQAIHTGPAIGSDHLPVVADLRF